MSFCNGKGGQNNTWGMKFSVRVSTIHTIKPVFVFSRNMNSGKHEPGCFSHSIFFSTFSRLLSPSHPLLRTCLRVHTLRPSLAMPGIKLLSVPTGPASMTVTTVDPWPMLPHLTPGTMS